MPRFNAGLRGATGATGATGPTGPPGSPPTAESRYVARDTNQLVANTTYVVAQSFTVTRWALGTIVTYDGVNELVVDTEGLYNLYGQIRWASNANGIRIAGFGVNDTSGAAPFVYHQERKPVNSDGNEDYVWVTTQMYLQPGDRICLKGWQNSAGNLNMTGTELIVSLHALV